LTGIRLIVGLVAHDDERGVGKLLRCSIGFLTLECSEVRLTLGKELEGYISSSSLRLCPA
jgi:hypothetical protein